MTPQARYCAIRGGDYVVTGEQTATTPEEGTCTLPGDACLRRARAVRGPLSLTGCRRPQCLEPLVRMMYGHHLLGYGW